MKKYFATGIILLLFLNIVTAQINYTTQKMMDFVNNNKILNGDYKPKLTESDIEGSPYLKDDFIKGSVYTKSKDKYVDIPLRYNIYNDQIEFKVGDNDVRALAAPGTIEKIEFDNYTMVYIPYAVAKKVRKGFFIVLVEGKASLYEKPQVMFKEATKPVAYQEAEPAKFVRNTDEYYIRVGESQAKLADNRKDLLEIFPDKQKQLETFIKKQKVKPSNPESLKKLVQYYNSL